VPELKRLQGFPDAYEFAGVRRSAQIQLGNAVPPALACVVAKAIRSQLEGKVFLAGQLSLPLRLRRSTAGA
jgi:DNA (cytosine-5)-methyltransferase 1